jgi:hypothetical protein
MSQMGGEGERGELAGSQPMSTAVQINFGDLTLFLTCECQYANFHRQITKVGATVH